MRALASSPRQELPPEALPFAAFAVVSVVFHLLLSADPRMLVPVIPPVIWLVAVALGRFVQVGEARPATAA